MRENKGCRTITAPPSEPGSSNEHREDQDPGPTAEGIGLVTSALDKKRRTQKETQVTQETQDEPPPKSPKVVK